MAILTESFLLDLTSLFATVTVIIYAYYKWAYQYWKRRGIPYLQPSIPFGNFPNPVTSKLSVLEHFVLLYNEAKSKGWKHCGLYTMIRPTYMILDPELLKRVMAKDFQYFVDRGMYINERDDKISAHLFASGGAKWKNLRTKLTPTFTSGKMKMMFQIMVDSGAILEKYVQENLAGKQVVDIKDVMGCFSTDVIGSCAFGLDCNSFKNPTNPFRVFGKKVVNSPIATIVKEAFALNFPEAAKALRIRVFDKDVEEFYTKVVKDTISYREKNNITRNDFLQLLMEIRSKKDEATDNGNTLTMDEIIAQSFVFFIAGFETSSTTMTFALFELARHPDIQDKVRKEIQTVLAKCDNKTTYDAMNELVYMKQVIDETLRMYPPLSVITRECVEDYVIAGEDIIIEKNTLIFIPVAGLQYDEDYYPNPKKFDPDRFTFENKNSRHQYVHLPFGEGPRVCIGERFGILQTKIGLTSILKNFKVTVNEKTKIPLKMDPKERVTAVEGGVWLNIEKL